MSNSIIFELCAEDRARLDKIIALLTAGAEVALQVPKTPQKPPVETQDGESQGNTRPEAETAKKAEKPAPTSEKTEEPKPAPAPKAEEPKVELSDVQTLVVKLATNGKKAEARDIVKSYAERVTEIPPEKYGEVYAKLKALEA